MASKTGAGDQVSVIGLGNMGSALAERLLATGYKVTIWNRTESKADLLAEAGASVAKTPVEAMSMSETIIICVLGIDAVQSILSFENAAKELKGKTVIQLTTLEPDQSRGQDEWMRQHNVHYLDGGILGFPADVRKGSARIAYSGSKPVFENKRSILESFGPNSIFVGEQAGMAPLAALLVYARYYGLTFISMHTAAMAAAAGIPASKLLELTGGDEKWMFMGKTMDNYVAMTEKGDYSTSEAALELDASVHNYFIRLSKDLGVDPALHEMIDSVLTAAIKQGRGDQAIAAIFEVLIDNPGS